MATVVIPFGGNAFITKPGKGNCPDVITYLGLGNWISQDTKCSIFFRVNQPEIMNVSLRLKVPQGVSKIHISMGDYQCYEVEVKGIDYYIKPIGKFYANSAGYVKIQLCGIQKTGIYFADVSDLILTNTHGKIQYVADTNKFYFGRRGPSVHLRYIPPIKSHIVNFYNEVTVPFGQDVVGAYFAAIGFHGGYFGIQVNSDEERRILFSVWSAYDTDYPERIPDDFKVKLIESGPEVKVQEFGNEGSGKQSYINYPWKTDVKYKFLVSGSPVDGESTKFTAWFWTPSSSKWKLVASFLKPKTATYLSGLHSFSENFKPGKGFVERRVLFGNSIYNYTISIHDCFYNRVYIFV